MHRHFPPRSTQLKQGTFPPVRFCCPHPRRYCIPLRLLTRPRPGFRTNGLIPRLPGAAAPRPREISLVAPMAVPAFRSPYAGGFFEAARPESSPLPWPSRSLRRSAPSCSPCGANMSALQDSLYGTDCGVALLPQEDTALHHPRSPRGSGSLLRGSLAITTTGLAPASHRSLPRHTSAMLAVNCVAPPTRAAQLRCRVICVSAFRTVGRSGVH
jgi:hypothetical protein